MSAPHSGPRPWEDVSPPGDDVVPVPAPVDEQPPDDSFCDLVLTGGVASGVVYPWAIVELARAYRFRNIGGTSVGAMAAVLAAAAEYGRRTGYEAPFEPLRRAPGSLAQLQPDGRTRMLSLFQPNRHGQRLLKLWGRLGRGQSAASTLKPGCQVTCPARPPTTESAMPTACCSRPEPAEQPDLCPSTCRRAERTEPPFQQAPGRMVRVVREVLRVYWRPVTVGLLAPVAIVLAAFALFTAQHERCVAAPWWVALLLLTIVAGLIVALVSLVWAVWSDIRKGVIDNSYGLCKGGSVKDKNGAEGPKGLTDWLHEGVQRSAGLRREDPPLTFRDLWTAPARPGAPRTRCDGDDPESQRAINLQMITTSVTHGRPYRLPLVERDRSLFYRPEDLAEFFPKHVLEAMVKASKPYQPNNRPGIAAEPTLEDPSAQGVYELPSADMPVVVAARLSLSFPLLFSAVPLLAIDYEAPQGLRKLRRCLFSDGGVSSNFPIHLFDAAVPRWPTFGFWLDDHPPYRNEPEGCEDEDDVWLPKYNEQGRGDNWYRFDPDSAPSDEERRQHADGILGEGSPRPGDWQDKAEQLLGFLGGLITSATNWRDRTSMRLPHVRNRVARLLLRSGEGGLHIGMTREQILQMAHRYGTTAGLKFVSRYADVNGHPSRLWSEQRWIRFNLLVSGLRERLDGLSTSAHWRARSQTLTQAIQAAQCPPGPVARKSDNAPIRPEEGAALTDALDLLTQVEASLQSVTPTYPGRPMPELRLRPPL